MDFINTFLVTVTQPTGFWQSILNAFKNGMGTYILAVIVVALIVRVLFSAVDIINKKVNMKNADINAKMKPELDAIKQRYGNDPQIMQQKTNEVYKKYQFNMMGSCLPMLLVVALQFVVFLTLWNGLQSIANYNIANQYQNMKIFYVNVIDANESTTLDSVGFQEGDQIRATIIVEENGEKTLRLTFSREGEGEYTFRDIPYKEKKKDENNKDVSYYSNEEIYNLLEKYVIETVKDAEGNDVLSSKYDSSAKYAKALKLAAEEATKNYFVENKEGFLWIKNIYKSESPTSPMFNESEIKTYLSKYYSASEKENEIKVGEDGKPNDFEGKIFRSIVENNPQLDKIRSEKNGYYILTIIAVATSILSLWLSNFLMRDKSKPKTKQSWAMYAVMPVIIGIFTFMYTSLFAIYLIVGQLVMMILTPLTTYIVRKWIKHDEDKNQNKNIIEVDYRRKDV